MITVIIVLQIDGLRGDKNTFCFSYLIIYFAAYFFILLIVGKSRVHELLHTQLFVSGTKSSGENRETLRTLKPDIDFFQYNNCIYI